MRRVGMRIAACAIGFSAMAAAACGHAIIDILTSAHVIAGSYGAYQHACIFIGFAGAAACAFGVSAISAISVALHELKASRSDTRDALLLTIGRPNAAMIVTAFFLQLPTLLLVE